MNSPPPYPDTLIVTPTLGDRQSIERTVQSVAEIGGNRVRHVIISPESKVAALAQSFPQCECIPEGPTKGVYAAVNQALNCFVEDYDILGYLNDDDYWLPNFKELFEVLDRHPEVSIGYGRVLFVDESNTPLFENTSFGHYQSCNRLLAHAVAMISQPATLFRRSVFQELGGFDESLKLYADTEFWLRAIARGEKLRYVDFACAAYMLQKGLLLSSFEASEFERIQVLNKHGVSRSFLSYIELFRFRLLNIDRYVKRVLFHRSASAKNFSG